MPNIEHEQFKISEKPIHHRKEKGGQIRIVVADDHRLFSEMLCKILDREGDIKIVGEAVNGFQTIDDISKYKPDVVLLCTSMPQVDGIKILPAIREKSPKTKVLVFNNAMDETMIFEALKSGAKGYLSKDVCIHDLIKAIQVVHRGELWVERNLMARFFDKEAAADSKGKGMSEESKEMLTPREKEVLHILSSGSTNKEIAKTLFISEKTVKSHLSSIFRKIKVTQRIKAILYAVNQGLS